MSESERLFQSSQQSVLEQKKKCPFVVKLEEEQAKCTAQWIKKLDVSLALKLQMTFQQHVTFTATFSEICFHKEGKDLVQPDFNLKFMPRCLFAGGIIEVQCLEPSYAI